MFFLFILRCCPTLLLLAFPASSNLPFFLQHWPHRRQQSLFPELDIRRQRTGYPRPIFSIREKERSDFGSTTFGIGGNFVGYYATFDSMTGRLIPVPEQYVPEALVEWGQEPSCLDVLVAEKEEEGQQNHFKRLTYTILPETGCAVDNLETLKTSESFHISPECHQFWQSSQPSNENAWLMWHRPTPGQSWRIECGFGWTSEQNDSSVVTDSSVFRTRLSIDAIQQHSDDYSVSSWQLVSPVRVWLERRIANSVSDLVEGGGLDGRTVSTLLGPLRVFHDFAAKKAQNVMDWQLPSDPNESIKTSLLLLPANITLAVAEHDGDLMLEVSRILSENQRRVLSVALTKSGKIHIMPCRWESNSSFSSF